MDNESVRVLARIELFTTERGGRESPVKGSWRPNHNFFGADNRELAMGSIEVPDHRQLGPGESTEVELTLWVWPGLRPELSCGRRWRIQEGAQLVGTGTILKLLS
jgi:translation elongation factor EF-Tu-like GTPase